MKTQDTLKLLREARDVLSSPDVWIKGAMAMNAIGETTPCDPTANGFCAAGALYRPDVNKAVIQKARETLERFIPQPDRPPFQTLVEYNDAPGTTHHDVMRLYAKAIHHISGEYSENA